MGGQHQAFRKRIVGRQFVSVDEPSEVNAARENRLRRGLKLRPEWAATWINIGASSFALGVYKDALDAYRQAAKLDDGNAEIQYSLGQTLNKLNRPDEEILAYRRAIALKPDHANSIEKLGLAFFNQRRYVDAAAAFDHHVFPLTA